LNPAGDELYKQEAELFTSILTKPVRQNLLCDQLLGGLLQTSSGKQNTASQMTDDFARQFPYVS